jgi:hypothetical protein
VPNTKHSHPIDRLKIPKMRKQHGEKKISELRMVHVVVACRHIETNYKKKLASLVIDCPCDASNFVFFDAKLWMVSTN